MNRIERLPIEMGKAVYKDTADFIYSKCMNCKCVIEIPISKNFKTNLCEKCDGKSRTEYQNLNEKDNLQVNIMLFVGWWVKERKVPVPRKQIMEELYKRKISRGTAEAALHALIMKGYIRKAYTISNKTTYVQLRSV